MGVLDSILEVFTSVGEWISTAVNNLVPMFYTAGADGGLTFLGVLAVASLAISVVFLIIGVNYWIAPTLLSRYHGGTLICANEEALLPLGVEGNLVEGRLASVSTMGVVAQ